MPETLSALRWDKDDERFYETGVDRVALYVMSSGTYGNGVAWSGVSGITETPGGAESNKIYADNIEYLNLQSAETLDGTITAYDSPKEFNVCDGTATPVAGVNFGQQERKSFGLAFRTKVGSNQEGDSYGYKIHLWYNCKAAPSEKSYSTVNESPEAVEKSWSISMTKTVLNAINDVNYKPLASITIDSRDFKTEQQKAALKLFEEKLWGRDSDSTASPAVEALTPTLPSPAEVVSQLTVAG